jgi:ribosome maturation factor RimP
MTSPVHDKEVQMGSTEGIRQLAAPALASAGVELWDVEVTRHLVRVLVERPGGIDLDGCAEASRVLSPLLDSRPDLVPDGSYQLEVSSPGAERTLRTVDQYRRYIGSLIAVKTNAPVEGARRHQGTLAYADESVVRIEPMEAVSDSLLELRHDQIDRSRTVLVWGSTGSHPERPAPSRSAKQRRAEARNAPAPATSAAHDSKDSRS